MKKNIIEVLLNLIINIVLVAILNHLLDVNDLFICFGVFFLTNFITYLFNKKDWLKYLSFFPIYLLLLAILGFYLNISMYIIIAIMHVIMFVLAKFNNQKLYEYARKGQEIEIISENVFYDMIDDYIEN